MLPPRPSKTKPAASDAKDSPSKSTDKSGGKAVDASSPDADPAPDAEKPPRRFSLPPQPGKLQPAPKKTPEASEKEDKKSEEPASRESKSSSLPAIERPYYMLREPMLSTTPAGRPNAGAAPRRRFRHSLDRGCSRRRAWPANRGQRRKAGQGRKVGRGQGRGQDGVRLVRRLTIYPSAATAGHRPSARRRSTTAIRWSTTLRRCGSSIGSNRFGSTRKRRSLSSCWDWSAIGRRRWSCSLACAGSKEHEAIISTPVKPSLCHAALLAAGAESGSPARFRPNYEPARGDQIDITLVWTDAKKQRRTAKAQDWILDVKSKKAMASSWVFAGSQFYRDPDTQTNIYLADAEGNLICVSNFTNAMLDLPIASSEANDELLFQAYTERIPPIGTPVTMILTPKKAAAKPAKPGETTGGKANSGRSIPPK